MFLPCCMESVCDNCIRNYFVEKKESLCPLCCANCLVDQLLPNKTVRRAVDSFLHTRKVENPIQPSCVTSNIATSSVPVITPPVSTELKANAENNSALKTDLLAGNNLEMENKDSFSDLTDQVPSDGSSSQSKHARSPSSNQVVVAADAPDNQNTSLTASHPALKSHVKNETVAWRNFDFGMYYPFYK